MNNKPNIILCRDFISLFDASISELKEIESQINNDYKQRVFKGLFLYSYSIFESTLTRLYDLLLNGFPQRINIDDLKLERYRNVLLSSSLTHNVIQSIVDDYSKKLSYGSIIDSLKKLCTSFQVDYGKINVDSKIMEIKNHRNMLAHNDTLNNKLDEITLLEYLKVLLDVLSNLREEVNARYGVYTKTKLVRDSWNYLFKSPILDFQSHWKLDENEKIVCYNSKTLHKYANSLSHSERTFFIFFMQNYSTSLCSAVYSTSDISMHVSINNKDKIAFITELFDKYPLLLQGDFD